MKTRARSGAFTLIELLVVIAIIGILAGILFPAVNGVNNSSRIQEARTEIGRLEGAILDYQAVYGQLPASKETRTQGLDPDFTFGTWGAGPEGATNSARNRKGAITEIWMGSAAKHNANNSEVMAILTGVRDYVSRMAGHPENPRNRAFFVPKVAASKATAGLGPDGVLRDPWGQPYIVSVDLNYDNQVRDAFYRADEVSYRNNKSLNGLTRTGPDANEYRGGVMVWSLGPDGEGDPKEPAHTGVNKDNILSWM